MNIPTEQVVEVTAEEFGQYQTWPELFRKMPRSYRNGMVLVMNDADFGKYIEGMTDANGQPVARVNYGLNGTIEERFLGREVIAVEDLLPPSMMLLRVMSWRSCLIPQTTWSTATCR